MLFSIGMTATAVMLSLLPSTSYCGRKKVTILLMLFYSILYFFIIQYGLSLQSSLDLPIFGGATILILYLTVVDKYSSQKFNLNEFLKIILFIMMPIALCLILRSDKNQYYPIDIIVPALILGISQSRFIKAPMLYQENTLEFYGLSTTAHLLILFIFLGVRKVNINLFWIDTIDIWALTLLVSFLCCLSAIVVGIKLNYLSFKWKKVHLKQVTIVLIFNLFHVAIAEEMIYRGFVYHYLRQMIGGGEWMPLALTTLLFGCHHISFGGKRMFVLATIAGAFYGLIYVVTGNLLTAAIVHTITNIVWRLFFIIKSD